jgi:hypothetical protein
MTFGLATTALVHYFLLGGVAFGECILGVVTVVVVLLMLGQKCYSETFIS